MDNPRPDKVAKVDEIAGKLESTGTIVVTEYRGLDVPQQAALRQSIRDAGGEFKIYKNSLTKIAAERVGVDIDGHLSGPTALAFAIPNDSGMSDPVALSKALTDFAKDNEAFVIKGGVMDGDAIAPSDVEALSKVPPREEMLAKFAGLLQAPMANFANLLQAMPRDFAGLVKALIDKGGAPGAPADEPAADDAPAAAAAEETDADAAPADDAEAADAPEAAAEGDDAEAAAEEQTDESADADSDDNEETKED